MKSVPACALLFFLCSGLSSVASAGSQLSPTIRIVLLEAGTTPDTLRLGVRKRLPLNDDLITLDTEVLNFNPAACTQLQIVVPGFSGSSTSVPIDYFDIQLNAPGRSVEERRQLLSAVLVSFTNSNNVQLYVRDDLCTNSGGRVVAGIVVN